MSWRRPKKWKSSPPRASNFFLNPIRRWTECAAHRLLRNVQGKKKMRGKTRWKVSIGIDDKSVACLALTGFVWLKRQSHNNETESSLENQITCEFSDENRWPLSSFVPSLMQSRLHFYRFARIFDRNVVRVGGCERCEAQQLISIDDVSLLGSVFFSFLRTDRQIESNRRNWKCR